MTLLSLGEGQRRQGPIGRQWDRDERHDEAADYKDAKHARRQCAWTDCWVKTTKVTDQPLILVWQRVQSLEAKCCRVLPYNHVLINSSYRVPDC